MIVYREENECQENLIETYSTAVFKAKVTKIDMQSTTYNLQGRIKSQGLSILVIKDICHMELVRRILLELSL